MSCDSKNSGIEQLSTPKYATLHGDCFLKGKIASIVYNDEEGYDSTMFVYNKDNHVQKAIFYFNGKEDGYCKYNYNGYNRVDLHYYNDNQEEDSYRIIEFDDRKNITLHRDYGYIYPDTANMVLLYMKHNSYDKDNRLDFAFEYYCDGTPSYKYKYCYNSDGTEVEECFLAVSGNIYTVKKKRRDKMGNIIEISENMPEDTEEWTNTKIEYKYDDKGNWIERKITSDAGYMNKHTKRKIYYIEE